MYGEVFVWSKKGVFWGDGFRICGVFRLKLLFLWFI